MQRVEIAPGITRIQFGTFDQWLDARHGIGGSDASAVIGKNPYKSNQDLWMEKTGRTVPPDISDKDYVRYGHAAEPLLRELFALDYPEYKVEYFGDNMIRNEKYPWLNFWYIPIGPPESFCNLSNISTAIEYFRVWVYDSMNY